MACDPLTEKLRRHITACRNVVLPAGRVRLTIGGVVCGYLRPDLLAPLAGLLGIEPSDPLPMPSGDWTPLARALGLRLRGEPFDVKGSAEGEVLGVLDRGALPDFGVIGVGAHLNGLVRRADGMHIWIARRAADKKLDPGKLDHLAAGGVNAGLTPFECLVKEAEEEAAIPDTLARQAKFVARIDYAMARPEGLRRDALFCYDLDLPEDFYPRALDGEVESFELWPAARVLEAVAETDDFKFNVNLVLIDLLRRLGLIAGSAAAKLAATLEAST
jgi:8-oxo-dGTP pyrophosphatase MutT (NUDIX family)